VSEPSTVKVNGQQATMTTSTNFVANPVLSTGTNIVSVVAMDGSGNAQTQSPVKTYGHCEFTAYFRQLSRNDVTLAMVMGGQVEKFSDETKKSTA